MGPEREKDERNPRQDERQPQDVQDEGRTMANDERPALEDLGRGEAPTEEHSG